MVFDNKFQQIIVKVICVLRAFSRSLLLSFSLARFALLFGSFYRNVCMSYNNSRETFASKFSYFIEHMLLISISAIAFLPLCHFQLFTVSCCDIVLYAMTFFGMKNILMSKKLALRYPPT